MNAITEHRPCGPAGRVFWGGWTARLDGPQRILPDASVSIAWSGDGRARLYGPHTRAWWAHAPAGSDVAWVAIRPGRLTLLPDVREVLDAELDLDAVLPAAVCRRLVDAVGRETSEGARIAALQRELFLLAGDRVDGDPVVRRLLAALRRDLSVSAAELADRLGLSVRQLHRRCNRALGFGPATLRRLLRLELFLRASCSGGTRAGLAELAAGSGFADQQHLARECRDLTGRTPTQLLSCA